jgi:hypothetical protein
LNAGDCPTNCPATGFFPSEDGIFLTALVAELTLPTGPDCVRDKVLVGSPVTAVGSVILEGRDAGATVYIVSTEVLRVALDAELARGREIGCWVEAGAVTRGVALSSTTLCALGSGLATSTLGITKFNGADRWLRTSTANK